MSRIGKAPVSIPKGVKASVSGRTLTVEGPLGKLEHALHPAVAVAVDSSTGVMTVTRDGDGRLSEQEWRLVRLAAQLEAEDRHAQASRAPEQNHLRRPPEGLPFLLSCKGEDELARTFRWQALGGALLCLGGALAVTWLLRQGG